MFFKKAKSVKESGFWKKHLACTSWPTREKGRKEVEMNGGFFVVEKRLTKLER